MRCFYELNGHGRDAYALHPQTLAASTRDFVVQGTSDRGDLEVQGYAERPEVAMYQAAQAQFSTWVFDSYDILL